MKHALHLIACIFGFHAFKPIKDIRGIEVCDWCSKNQITNLEHFETDVDAIMGLNEPKPTLNVVDNEKKMFH